MNVGRRGAPCWDRTTLILTLVSVDFVHLFFYFLSLITWDITQLSSCPCWSHHCSLPPATWYPSATLMYTIHPLSHFESLASDVSSVLPSSTLPNLCSPFVFLIPLRNNLLASIHPEKKTVIQCYRLPPEWESWSSVVNWWSLIGLHWYPWWWAHRNSTESSPLQIHWS